jgi:hypothetical protein
MVMLCSQVSNVANSCRAALAASSSALADKVAGLQSELDATLSHFDGIVEGTAELEVEVTDEVRVLLLLLLGPGACVSAKGVNGTCFCVCVGGGGGVLKFLGEWTRCGR